MNLKRVLRKALSLVMIAVLAVSMFACNGGEKETEEEKVFANQLVNDRYRFSQGYPEDWDYTQGNGGTAMRTFYPTARSEGWLLAKLVSKTNPNLVYTVYKFDPGSDISTTSEWMNNLMNKVDPNKGTASYIFNEVFTEEADMPRDTYVMTSADYSSAYYVPQVEWFEVDFDFVKDGEDWKGSFHVTKASEAGWFFLVVCEAKATEWDANQTVFADMLKDFRDIGRGGSTKK